jgi:hypothetical protein
LSFSPPFQRALQAACDDADTLAGELEHVGAGDSDVLALAAVLCDEYAPDLGEGGPPRAHAVVAIVALCLHTGARLERQHRARDSGARRWRR